MVAWKIGAGLCWPASLLEKAGVLDRTFIVYSSDHGYKQGQWRVGTSKQHPCVRTPEILPALRSAMGLRSSSPSAPAAVVSCLMERRTINGSPQKQFLVRWVGEDQSDSWHDIDGGRSTVPR